LFKINKLKKFGELTFIECMLLKNVYIELTYLLYKDVYAMIVVDLRGWEGKCPPCAAWAYYIY